MSPRWRSTAQQKSPHMRISRNQAVAVITTALQMPLREDSLRGIALDVEVRDTLMRWARGSSTPRRVATRSTVVLLASAGWSNARIALALGISRRTVALWKERFAGQGAQTLLVDAPGRGRKPGRNPQIVARIAAMTSQHPPGGGRWTVRTLARAVGVSHATVQRVWREQAIRPSAMGARAN
jgi:transposase